MQILLCHLSGMTPNRHRMICKKVEFNSPLHSFQCITPFANTRLQGHNGHSPDTAPRFQADSPANRIQGALCRPVAAFWLVQAKTKRLRNIFDEYTQPETSGIYWIGCANLVSGDWRMKKQRRVYVDMSGVS